MYVVISGSVLGLKYPVSRAIYKKSNHATDKIIKMLRFASIKIIQPFGMICIWAMIFFVYFTTDLGNDAFQSPFPYWHVHFLHLRMHFFPQK